MSNYQPRPTSPRPPTFPAGATVAFEAEGVTYLATFVRRTSLTAKAGVDYVVTYQGRQERIFANGLVGRTMRVA